MSTWSLGPVGGGPVANDMNRMLQLFEEATSGLLPARFLSQHSQLAPLVDIKETKDKFVSVSFSLVLHLPN